MGERNGTVASKQGLTSTVGPFSELFAVLSPLFALPPLSYSPTLSLFLSSPQISLGEVVSQNLTRRQFDTRFSCFSPGSSRDWGRKYANPYFLRDLRWIPVFVQNLGWVFDRVGRVEIEISSRILWRRPIGLVIGVSCEDMGCVGEDVDGVAGRGVEYCWKGEGEEAAIPYQT